MDDLRPPSIQHVLFDVGAGSARRTADLYRVAGASVQPDGQPLSVERTVEFEIVPRLVLAHRGARSGDGSDDLPRVTYAREVRAFAELVLGRNPDAASAHVQALIGSGATLETVYLNLISPTARYLKHKWHEDEHDFADVTLGLWRLQQVLREFGTAFRSDAQKSTGLRTLLSPGPGEAHDLGYMMFDLVLHSEFYRRDGWDAWIEPRAETKELVATVRNEWFDVVQFLVTGDKRLDELAALIQRVRQSALNPALGVICCGPAFVEQPELLAKVGGDISAADPRNSVAQAQNLVGAIASRV